MHFKLLYITLFIVVLFPLVLISSQVVCIYFVQYAYFSYLNNAVVLYVLVYMILCLRFNKFKM